MSSVQGDEPADGGVGTGAAVALVVGYTIAVGIFLTPAEVIGGLASPGLILALWLLCGGLVLAGALTFGELATRYPEAGGPYVFLREAWGERAAFLYGWQALLVMDPGVTAALATGLSQYLVVVWPAAAGHERSLAVGVIWLLAGVGMAGLRPGLRVLGALTAIKVAVLVGVVVLAFVRGDGSWDNLTPFLARPADAAPLGPAVAAGLVGVFFSYGGFWDASRVAGEVRDRNRTLPVALAAGVALVTAIYIATTVAFLYLVPVEEAGSASEFARRAGEAIFGPSGPPVLAAVVVLSVVASLAALFIMVPRVYVAMERDRVLPSALVYGSPGAATPSRAVVLLAALASLFVFVGTFDQIVAFFLCTTLTFVAAAAAGLFRVRRGAPAPGTFRCPGYPLTPALFVALVLAVVIMVAANLPLQAAAGALVVAAGLPVHHWITRPPRR